MNERMLELARQVWPDPNISHANHMKFAELIVKECADLVDDHDDSYPYVSFGDMIKQHFGVKE
jgi:acetone carboxylase gamma subunit